MRFITFILLLYILGISAIPCVGISADEDTVECCANKACTGEDTGSDESSNDDCAHCNPFFACSSCYSAFLITPYFSLATNTENIPDATNFTHYTFSFIQLSYSIWQPPKLTV